MPISGSEKIEFQAAAEWFISFVSRPSGPADSTSSDICNDQTVSPAPVESPIDVAERLLFH